MSGQFTEYVSEPAAAAGGVKCNNTTAVDGSPQQKAWPVALSPHVWPPPALICEKTTPPATLTGVVLSIVELSPSAPYSLYPAGRAFEHMSGGLCCDKTQCKSSSCNYVNLPQAIALETHLPSKQS